MTTADFDALVKSGELARMAQQSPSLADMAATLGLSAEGLRQRLKRMRMSWSLLKYGDPTRRSNHAQAQVQPAAADFADEEPTIELPDSGPAIPSVGHIPPGHFESGRSTLVRNTDPNSNVVLTWHKTSVSKQQHLEAIQRAFEELPKPWRGMSEPVEQTQPSSDQLLNVFMMGDPHLGLMTWGKETGTDHDLATGERDLVAAIDHLVGEAPAADIGIVCSLGDLVHVDSESNTTTRGTKQDADSRWFKMMLTTLRAKRHAIDEAKKKHRKVLGRIIRGNHDWHSSAMIAMGLAQYYENDPRVEIEVSPDPFSWFEFGKNLLGWTHTDECNKPDDLAAVMAVDQAEAWGRTIYRYMMGGHEHHTFAKETRGVLVEKFPTLAPKCSWAHRKGYRALQSMCVDTYHAEYGRIGRRTVGIRQLRAA